MYAITRDRGLITSALTDAGDFTEDPDQWFITFDKEEALILADTIKAYVFEVA